MKRRLVLTAIVVFVAFVFAMVANMAEAKDSSVTLAPGETARIPLRFWCLDFGKPFPTAITGPIELAPEAAQKALQAAIARGATESDPYQTQLAIWRATDGSYHDVAGTGHVLAEQIYSDSLKINLSPAVTNTLAAAVTQGSVAVTFEDFKPISDTAQSQIPPYHGTAAIVIKNVSNQNVTFVVSEFALFKPASGTSEQSLVSQQDTTQRPTLPTTGGNGVQDIQNRSLLLLAFGGLLMALGVGLIAPAFRRTRVGSKMDK